MILDIYIVSLILSTQCSVLFVFSPLWCGFELRQQYFSSPFVRFDFIWIAFDCVRTDRSNESHYCLIKYYFLIVSFSDCINNAKRIYNCCVNTADTSVCHFMRCVLCVAQHTQWMVARSSDSTIQPELYYSGYYYIMVGWRPESE